MHYRTYHLACFFTSIIMLIILLPIYKKINFCYILILSAIFSAIWRLYNFIVTLNDNPNKIYTQDFYNPLFILDLLFAFLAIICICRQKNFPKIYIYLSFILFFLSWFSYFNNNRNASKIIHTLGHIYIICIIFFIYYFYK